MPSTTFTIDRLGTFTARQRMYGWGLLLASVGALLMVVWFSMFQAAGEVTSNAKPPDSQDEIVHLGPAKLEAAAIKWQAVEKRSLRATRTVAGSLTYDQSRQVLITTPVSGIVKQVLVDPGQAVEEGAPLVVLTSSEIGVARDEIIKRRADLEIARREEARADAVAQNVEELLSLLEAQRPIAEIEQAVVNKVLGEQREKLVGAYSRLLLAEAASASSTGLQDGVLSSRALKERKSARETAAALFHTASEAARFEVAQNRMKAKAAAEQAQRLLNVSRDRLTAFLGSGEGAMGSDKSQGLNDFVLPAPRAGRIDQRHVAAGQRFEAGQSLFTLADTSVLWLSAEIHERDWAQLTVSVGDFIQARIPALDDERIKGKLRFVGTHVEPETRAVPLVAEIDNSAGRLKPGMFAWIDAPIAREQQAVAVPASAVQHHAGETFVFVPESPSAFRRVDVKTGLETQDYVEILRGIATGERVVTEGAFYLKSELLLDREGE